MSFLCAKPQFHGDSLFIDTGVEHCNSLAQCNAMQIRPASQKCLVGY